MDIKRHGLPYREVRRLHPSVELQTWAVATTELAMLVTISINVNI